MLLTIIVFSIVILDQVTKYLADVYLKGNDAVTLIPDVVSLNFHRNSGAAWGLFADQPWIFMVPSVIAIIFITFFLIYTRKMKTSRLLRISLAFFLGGGIGNMIDRIRLTYVIDFLRLDFIDFPIFNVADSFITIGAFMMILYMILDIIEENKAKRLAKKGIE